MEPKPRTPPQKMWQSECFSSMLAINTECGQVRPNGHVQYRPFNRQQTALAVSSLGEGFCPYLWAPQSHLYMHRPRTCQHLMSRHFQEAAAQEVLLERRARATCSLRTEKRIVHTEHMGFVSPLHPQELKTRPYNVLSPLEIHNCQM